MIMWIPEQMQTTRRYRGRHRKSWSLKRELVVVTLSCATIVAVPTALLILLAVALEK